MVLSPSGRQRKKENILYDVLKVYLEGIFLWLKQAGNPYAKEIRLVCASTMGNKLSNRIVSSLPYRL